MKRVLVCLMILACIPAAATSAEAQVRPPRKSKAPARLLKQLFSQWVGVKKHTVVSRIAGALVSEPDMCSVRIRVKNQTKYYIKYGTIGVRFYDISKRQVDYDWLMIGDIYPRKYTEGFAYFKKYSPFRTIKSVRCKDIKYWSAWLYLTNSKFYEMTAKLEQFKNYRPIKYRRILRVDVGVGRTQYLLVKFVLHKSVRSRSRRKSCSVKVIVRNKSKYRNVEFSFHLALFDKNGNTLGSQKVDKYLQAIDMKFYRYAVLEYEGVRCSRIATWKLRLVKMVGNNIVRYPGRKTTNW